MTDSQPASHTGRRLFFLLSFFFKKKVYTGFLTMTWGYNIRKNTLTHDSACFSRIFFLSRLFFKNKKKKKEKVKHILYDFFLFSVLFHGGWELRDDDEEEK